MNEFDPSQPGTFLLAASAFGPSVLHIVQNRSLLELLNELYAQYPSSRFSSVNIFDLKPASAQDPSLPGLTLRCLKVCLPREVNTTYINACLNNIMLASEDERLSEACRLQEMLSSFILYIKERSSEANGT